MFGCYVSFSKFSICVVVLTLIGTDWTTRSAATKRKEMSMLVEKVKKRRGGGAGKEAEKKTQ